MGSVKSSLYAYCVTRLEMNEPWDVFPGVADKPVFAVRDQKIAMLVSRMDRLKLDEQKHVIQHGHVLNRAFQKSTVLPFRFGTTFQSEDAIRMLLAQNRDQFIEGLRVLRGKAEVHLKLGFKTLHRATPAGTNGGSQVARLTVSSNGYSIANTQPTVDAAKQQVDHILDCIRTTFQPIQDQVAVRHQAAGGVQLEVRCLVADSHVDFCKKFALKGFDSLEDLQMQVTGPWPPCHFLPVSAKLPNRTERVVALPGRLPLRSRAARV